jgi:hypothetical protein
LAFGDEVRQLNTHAKQPLRLDAIAVMPAHNNLVHLAQLATQAPGRLIQLPWTVESVQCKYVLSVRCIEPTNEFVAKKAIASEAKPQWTLIRRQDFSSTQVWNHTTGDLGLVLNLLASEVSGVQLEAPETVGLAASFQALDDQARAKRQQVTTTPNFKSGSEVKGSPELRNMILGGNLAEVELPNILQSINLCKMTGRLDCFQGLSQVEVFFEEGVPKHAIAHGALQSQENPMVTGDAVILDLLTWDSGTFHFNPVWTSTEQTVKRRLESLLLEGMTLRDYASYLRKAGFDFKSPLSANNKGLTNEELEEVLKSGIPLDLSLQRQVYRLIEETASVEQILRRMPIHKAQWLPIMFNLLSCNLIAASSEKPIVSTREEKRRVEIDYKAANAAARNLLKPETGLLIYPLFLHFLQQEIERALSADHSFSVVVFEIKADGQALPNVALRQIGEAFMSMGERFDQIAHYRSFEEYVMLLPYQSSQRAYEFTSDFATWLLTNPLEGVQEYASIRLAFGIATFPEDCDTLPVLLATAADAKQQSANTDNVVFTFQNVSDDTKKNWSTLRAARSMASH